VANNIGLSHGGVNQPLPECLATLVASELPDIALFSEPGISKLVGEAIVRNSCRRAHIAKYGCPPLDHESPEPNGHDTEAKVSLLDAEGDSYKPPKARGRHFEVLAFEEIKLDTRSAYLVRGILPRIGLVIIWGPPKCGKSFWVFDLMMHVALGWQYRGRRVKQGAVIYCAPEGAHGFKARIEAFRQTCLAEQAEGIPFYLVPATMALVKDHRVLIADIRSKLGDIVPAAVVIDTLNRSISGSESDDRDMRAYLSAADMIRETFNCMVLIVHHCGHDGTRPRGHSSITGTVEAQIAVKRDEANNIVSLVEEMKDGPDGAQITSRLESVEVGTDEDGEKITSCVVVPVEGAPLSAQRPAKVKPLKGARKLVFDALRYALGECGKIPPACNHIPSNVKCVTLDQWQDYAVRSGLCASGKPDSKRVAFGRASDALIGEGYAAIWDSFVWAVHEKGK
jgi:hypothetical protein